jgi:Flp pilus assembly protein CpaB
MATTAPPRPTAAQRGRLPAPVRDRRPALAALALLLVLGGALSSALIAYRSGDRIDVLVAARDISVGEEITAADLRVARVAADGAAFVESSAAANFVGTRARTEVPEGTLVNRTMFLAGSLVPRDAAVVGVVLGAAQRPAGGLRAGDVVRVFAVGRDGEQGASGVELARAVRVSAVSADGDGLGLSLLVPAGQAQALVAAAAAGQVAVAALAPETAPLVDFARP